MGVLQRTFGVALFASMLAACGGGSDSGGDSGGSGTGGGGSDATSIDITLYDRYLRCETVSQNVEVVVYDNTGSPESFDRSYSGVEESFTVEPTGSGPYSVRITTGDEQHVGVGVELGADLSFVITPEDSGCACSTYSITLNQESANARLYKRDLAGVAGSVGGGQTVWSGVEVCEDEFDSFYIQDRTNSLAAKVEFDGGANITVEGLGLIGDTLLDGEQPLQVITRGYMSRRANGTLEEIIRYVDLDVRDAYMDYLDHEDITDYRVDALFLADYVETGITEFPDLFDGSEIGWGQPFEFQSALLGSTNLAAGFTYNRFDFDDTLDLEMRSDGVRLTASGGLPFDGVVVVSNNNGALVIAMLPIESNGLVDFSALEDAGITSLDDFITLLPVDYVSGSSYQNALESLFRRDQPGQDIGFRYIWVSIN